MNNNTPVLNALISNKSKQTNFQDIVSSFLKKNNYYTGATAAVSAIMIAIASFLSLISFWIPFSIAGCIFLAACVKIKSGTENPLTTTERKLLILLKDNER